MSFRFETELKSQNEKMVNAIEKLTQKYLYIRKKSNEQMKNLKNLNSRKSDEKKMVKILKRDGKTK